MTLIRIALFSAVLFGSVLLGQQPPAPTKPSKEQIARWVAQLGADDFNAREEASRLLWEAGEATEPALLAALKGGDLEVMRRAREVLDKFKWGLYPSTPKDLAALIMRYQQAEGDGKAEVVRELLDAGTPGCKALLRIVTAESVPDNHKAVRNQLAVELSRALPRLLEQKELALLDELLAASMEADEQLGLRNTVACWLLTGQVDKKIERYQAQAAGKGKDREIELHIMLLRARGDLVAARDLARQAEREDLVNAMLYEVGDWKEDFWPQDAAGAGRQLEKLGYRAACYRLAGKIKEFDDIVAEIFKLAESIGAEEEKRLFDLTRVLLLNHRPREALEVLAKSPAHTGSHFEILTAQRKYPGAFALVEKAKAAGSDQLPTLELLQARTLAELGEKEARAIFARYGERIKVDDGGRSGLPLIEAEVEVGLVEDAFEHAVRLARALPGTEDRYLRCFFPNQIQTLMLLNELLRELSPNDDTRSRMNRLRQLLSGKVEAGELGSWVKQAETAIKSLDPGGTGVYWLALADACLECKQMDLARQCLSRLDSAQGLLRLGDLLALRKDWEEAARHYCRAWEKDRSQPLPLYLSGKALVRAGRVKEGQQRMELAHALPLGNLELRSAFLEALVTRSDSEAVRRQSELLFRLAPPDSTQARAALFRLGLDAVERHDPARAGDYMDRHRLRALAGGFSSSRTAFYVTSPAMACQQRLTGLLAEGKFDLAWPHIARVEELVPGFERLAVDAVPKLEKLGRKKEADELFARTIAFHEKLCQAYPRCAAAHEAIAWTSAGCRRNLDSALEHARKAVELAPHKTDYLDTLAEVYFQRGEQVQAIATAKKVIARDPYQLSFRKQLRRMEAGDRSAPMPPHFLIAGDRKLALVFGEED